MHPAPIPVFRIALRHAIWLMTLSAAVGIGLALAWEAPNDTRVSWSAFWISMLVVLPPIFIPALLWFRRGWTMRW